MLSVVAMRNEVEPVYPMEIVVPAVYAVVICRDTDIGTAPVGTVVELDAEAVVAVNSKS
jgi:hypothetical protein